MKVVITGAAGFLGKKLAEALLRKDALLQFDELILVDNHLVRAPAEDARVRCLVIDLGDPKAANSLIDSRCSVIFHLAAVVSGQAERDFDIGMKVNFDATRFLLEAARHNAPSAKFIYTSSCAVFGGNIPPLITDYTAVTPENSYGMEKALCELLINDYSRRGFVDGRALRLPTVTVRPGSANKAVTSFVSGMIREPLNGEKCVIPVSKELPIWVCSPNVVIRNIIHAAVIEASYLGSWRTVNLPGITVTVHDMLEALRVVAGDKIMSLISFQLDNDVNNILVTLPKSFDTTRARKLGFHIDNNYEEIVHAYVSDNKIFL